MAGILETFQLGYFERGSYIFCPQFRRIAFASIIFVLSERAGIFGKPVMLHHTWPDVLDIGQKKQRVKVSPILGGALNPATSASTSHKRMT
jgi:hypothetical protein